MADAARATMAAADAGVAVNGAVAARPPAKAKVKLRRSVVDKIAALNASATLPKPLRLGAVAAALSALADAEALALLDRAVQELDVDDPAADPNAWVCREGTKAAAARASRGTTQSSALSTFANAGDAGAQAAAESAGLAGDAVAATGGLAAAVAAAAALAERSDRGGNGGTDASGGIVGVAADAGAPAEGGIAAIAGSVVGAAAVPVPEASKKVKLKRKVVDRLKALNAEGTLLVPIRLGTVAGPLAAMDESAALSLLDQLAQDAEVVEDPTAHIVGIARADSLAAEQQDEEWKEWEQYEADKAGELADLLSPVVLEKVRGINRQLILETPLVLGGIAGPLALHEEDAALQILTELEAEGSEVENPVGWVIRNCLRKAGKVMGRVDKLNKLMYKPGAVFLLSRLDASKVRGPLHAIPQNAALQLLDELEKRCHDIEDPTTWVTEAAERELNGSRVNMLFNKVNVSLKQPIQHADIGRTLDSLLQLSEPMACSLLYDLKKRSGSINKPVGWLFSEVARRSSGNPLPPWKATGDMTPIMPQKGKAGGKGKRGEKGLSKGAKGEKGNEKGKRAAPAERSAPGTPPKAPPSKRPDVAATNGRAVGAAEVADGEAEETFHEDFDAEAAEEAALLELREAFGEQAAVMPRPARPKGPTPAVPSRKRGADVVPAAGATAAADRPEAPAKRARMQPPVAAAATGPPPRHSVAAPTAAELEAEQWQEEEMGGGSAAGHVWMQGGDEDDLQ